MCRWAGRAREQRRGGWGHRTEQLTPRQARDGGRRARSTPILCPTPPQAARLPAPRSERLCRVQERPRLAQMRMAGRCPVSRPGSRGRCVQGLW